MQPAPAPPAATERLRRVRKAVHELMSEQGLRISMDAVAARAGCSKQTLYAQFGSKQALLRKVAQAHLEQVGAALDDDATGLHEALLHFAVEHLDMLADATIVASCQLISAEASQFPDEARALFVDGHGRLLELLAARLKKAMQRGQLRHDEPLLAAELLLGMIIGSDFERQRLNVPHRDTPGARLAWAEFAIETFLRAFSPLPSLGATPPRSS